MRTAYPERKTRVAGDQVPVKSRMATLATRRPTAMDSKRSMRLNLRFGHLSTSAEYPRDAAGTQPYPAVPRSGCPARRRPGVHRWGLGGLAGPTRGGVRPWLLAAAGVPRWCPGPGRGPRSPCGAAGGQPSAGASVPGRVRRLATEEVSRRSALVCCEAGTSLAAAAAWSARCGGGGGAGGPVRTSTRGTL